MNVRFSAFAAVLFLSVSPARAQEATPPKPATPPAATPPAANKNEKLDYALTLTDGAATIQRTRREMGFSLKDGETVAFNVNLAALKDALARIAPKFHQDAVGAKPYVEKGLLKISPGTQARALNIPTTAEKIVQAVAGDPSAHTFTVALDKKPPVLTAERLKGVNGVLASFTTRTSDNSNRNHNIALAVEKIDGLLLSPGETFSLNNAVGERTQKSGFLTAPVFVNAEKVPGIGGGVSQVTGTLFNAAARAGLKIVEVNPHSRPVAYLPLGYDATVAFGDKDLKFTNDTQTPVYLSYHFQKRTLTATLFGAKVPGRAVSLSARINRIAPGKINAQLYRTIKMQGKVTAKQKLFSHAYRWDPTKKE